MPIDISHKSEISVGEIYEDGSYHPCICMGYEDDYCVWGVSLIDGSYPRMSDLKVGGTRKLTPEEAWDWKRKGPSDAEPDPKYRWWK